MSEISPFSEDAALAYVRGYLDGRPPPPMRQGEYLRVGLSDAEKRLAIEELRLSRLSRKEAARELRTLDRRIKTLGEERDHMHRMLSALRDLEKWCETSAFEPALTSGLPSLVDAIQTGRALFSKKDEAAAVEAWVDECLIGIQTIVVGRDWASVFKSAEGFSEGEVRLPADNCAFAFKFSGHDYIVLFGGDPLSYLLFSKTDFGWLCTEPTAADLTASASDDAVLNAQMWRQIRAICIMLDAEVASREIVRAPNLSSKSAAAIDPTIYDYSVISLRRSSAEHIHGSETGKHKRLHFRRGHWRHYAGFNTWIRWCLAGDPTLGWVDKEYRA